MTALSVMRLLPGGGHITGGRIVMDDTDLVTLTDRQMENVRGNQIGMVFQDPMTSLNPTMTIGDQIAESVRIHRGASKPEATHRAVEVLGLVGMPRPAERVGQYPHQLSGGMRQRVMIAMALACDPRLLIADEPTTALDVTLQAQILDLMHELKAESSAAIILITHDLGVVAEVCDEVAVMYAGEVVEHADVDELFASPQHPYTVGLLGSIPRLDQRTSHLATIEGMVPNMSAPPKGCRFAARCPFVESACTATRPPFAEVSPGHWSRCIRAPLEGLVS
jgi:peptide/nickel transport system ATP-binding protein